MDIENVDIKTWAQEIREIKIRELREIITEKQKVIDSFVISDWNSACGRTKLHLDVVRLTRKLDILNKK